MVAADLVVYPARIVRTKDPARPTAQAIAVRGDRIRAVGSLDELASYGPARIDRRYEDSVLLPGFVEAHSHASAGAMWRATYVGYFPQTRPDGRQSAACRTVDEIVAELARAEASLRDPAEPLIAWGLDPLYFTGARLDAQVLDRVSRTRPIIVMHASLHMATINSAAIALDRIDQHTGTAGVITDAAGRPTGELQELRALALTSLYRAFGQRTTIDAGAIRSFGALARNVGATTVTDLASVDPMDDAAVAMWTSVVGDPSFPARIHQFLYAPYARPFPEAAARLVALRARPGTKLRHGGVKLILDGSIQGFTARLQEPGYLGGRANGIWNIDPQTYEEAFRTFHEAGLQIHVHCNGDEASELFITTLARVLVDAPQPGHRHTVTHSQMTTPAQYRRLAELGACANIFSNHLWYWGDQHAERTVGIDRASRMDAAATALRCGLEISLHSDAPVTPLNPLLTAMYAATRRTPSGRVLGETERMSLDEALRAVTLGGAYLLRADAEIGSLEAGKMADLAVLDTDPYEMATDPERLAEVTVRGSMVGGVDFPAGQPVPGGW